MTGKLKWAVYGMRIENRTIQSVICDFAFKQIGKPADNGVNHRRFAEDLKKHPARKNLNPDDTAPFAKILGAFRGGNPKPERLQALFGEAQKRYGAVGLRALQSFATQAALENKAVAKRIASRRSL